MSRSTGTLTRTLLLSACLTIVVGCCLLAAGLPLVGAFVMAAGFLDLLLIPIVGRSINRAADPSIQFNRTPGSGPAAGTSTAESVEQDPSYNPYARED